MASQQGDNSEASTECMVTVSTGSVPSPAPSTLTTAHHFLSIKLSFVGGYMHLVEIDKGFSLRRGVQIGISQPFNLSAVLFQSSIDGSSRSRSVEISSKVLVNPQFAVFNRTPWSKSVNRSSTELINPLFDSVCIQSLSKELISSLFTIFTRSRSAKSSSVELVVVVSSPQWRTRKKREFLTLIRDFVSEKSQGERRISNMRNRIGELRSEITAATANIEEACAEYAEIINTGNQYIFNTQSKYSYETVEDIFVEESKTFANLFEEFFDKLTDMVVLLPQMEKYVLAELVCLLREVRPVFSTGEAMWYLLICDMDVSQACAMDNDFLSNSVLNGVFLLLDDGGAILTITTTLNVPLDDGIDDESYQMLFKSIMGKVMVNLLQQKFPGAIVFGGEVNSKRIVIERFEKEATDIEYWIIVATMAVSGRIGDAFISWIPMEIARNLMELRTAAGDIALMYWRKASSYGQTRIFDIFQFIVSQSTSSKSFSSAPQPQMQGSRVHQPTAPPKQRSKSAMTTKPPQNEEQQSPSALNEPSSEHVVFIIDSTTGGFEVGVSKDG
nr:putative HVA22-like protein G isoform X1 [Ipomoea batatas]